MEIIGKQMKYIALIESARLLCQSFLKMLWATWNLGEFRERIITILCSFYCLSNKRLKTLHKHQSNVVTVLWDSNPLLFTNKKRSFKNKSKLMFPVYLGAIQPVSLNVHSFSSNWPRVVENSEGIGSVLC